MMVNRDVLMRKIANVKHHVERVRDRDYGSIDRFIKDLDSEDLAVFNLQMAIQFCIDIASHLIAYNDWGVPSSMKDTFDVLFKRKVISESTRDTMQAMAGFRNLIIHDYTEVDFKKVYDVVKNRLDDFTVFLNEVATYAKL